MKPGTHVRPCAELSGQTYRHGYVLGPGPLPGFTYIWWLGEGLKVLLQDVRLTPMSDQPRARLMYGCPPDHVLKAHGAQAPQQGAARRAEKGLRR